MRTFFPKGKELAGIERKWYLIDAEGVILGRLSTFVADILSGKNKPEYTPYVDMGDNVIIINADKVVLTGKKLDDKIYYHSTGYPGHLKAFTVRQMLSKHPDRILLKAVKGMLPKTKLGAKMFGKIKVYASAEHPHSAQKPVPLVVPAERRFDRGIKEA
jgi:large subunit ribosomal protein L13